MAWALVHASSAIAARAWSVGDRRMCCPLWRGLPALRFSQVPANGRCGAVVKADAKFDVAASESKLQGVDQAAVTAATVVPCAPWKHPVRPAVRPCFVGWVRHGLNLARCGAAPAAPLKTIPPSLLPQARCWSGRASVPPLPARNCCTARGHAGNQERSPRRRRVRARSARPQASAWVARGGPRRSWLWGCGRESPVASWRVELAWHARAGSRRERDGLSRPRVSGRAGKAERCYWTGAQVVVVVSPASSASSLPISTCGLSSLASSAAIALALSSDP